MTVVDLAHFLAVLADAAFPATLLAIICLT